MAGDTGSNPGSGRSPGEGNGNPLQYFSLGRLMDRGAWQAPVHGVAESWPRLSIHTHTLSKTDSTLIFLSYYCPILYKGLGDPWILVSEGLGVGCPRTNFLQILRETCIYKAVQSSCPESRFIYSAIMVSLVKETFKVLLRQLGW